MSRSGYGVAAAALASLVACGSSADTVAELKNAQAEIDVKLLTVERTLDRLAKASPPSAAPPAFDPAKVYDLPVGASPVKGSATAKVVIVEFADFQCPFCAQSAKLVDDVLRQYPNDVKLVFKQFPLTQIHPLAMHAAKASLAAHKQGKFWPFHDVLFANSRALQPQNVKKYAAESGLDLARFEEDIASPAIARQIDEEMRLAREADVRATPTLFVNGKRVTNRSLEGLRAMIDPFLDRPQERAE
jgi:protein-disulfide isomerase